MRGKTILLDHGSGGQMAYQLISEIIAPIFADPVLSRMEDSAVCPIQAGRLAFSTDSYVVSPLFFPGGDIGELAVNGTVNDVAMSGAVPLYLSTGLIIEEGFLLSDLKRIAQSMKKAADQAGVRLVTGDTKVVPKGAADRIFINTAGVGQVPETVRLSAGGAEPGDQVILSGTIADHGMTVMAQREELGFDADIQSDTAPLNRMVRQLTDAVGDKLHALRDPTRGGLGTALNEIARQSGVGMRIQETAIPVRPPVQSLCELLGFDPLYVANEGKLIAFVAPEAAQSALAAIRADPYGKEAAIIGQVTDEPAGKVLLQTLIGGTRILDMLTGEQLPRIC